jgi:hypothetical protein
LNKLFARREAAKKAGQDELALKYSAKIHNYATMGGARNPKNVSDSVEYDMNKRLDEKKVLAALLRKALGMANKSWVKGQKKRGTPEEQEEAAVKKDGRPWHDFRDRG